MKTLFISAVMMIFAIQISQASEVSKSHNENSGSPRIIREIR